MIRFLIIGAVVALFVVVAASLVGSAIDNELRERVIFTRGGVTFDCERRFVPEGEVIQDEDGSSVIARVGGEVTYGNCHIVP